MFPLLQYFEWAALITAIVAWPAIKKNSLKWFLPFLLLINIAELAGWYIQYQQHGNNGYVYNISVPIEYIFYGAMFYLHSSKKIIKIAALCFIGGIFVYAAGYSVFDNIQRFNTNYLLMGSAGLLILSIAYFLELYNSPSNVNLFMLPMFWITTGILLFNAGEFIYNLVLKFSMSNNLPYFSLFHAINNKLVILLYLLISAGLITQKLQPNGKRVL